MFLEIDVQRELVHQTVDGKRYLLIHGDQFDQVTQHHKWVAVLGDKAYEALVNLNTWLSWVRRKLGISGYWSLAGYAKRKVKTALNFIFDFEESATYHARERNLDANFVDDDELQAALARSRRAKLNKTKKLKPEDLAKKSKH